MFSLEQNLRRRGQNRFCPELGAGGGTTMYTHVSKCTNDKIKRRKKKTMLVYPKLK
jgi:hypothetical protein